MLGQGIVKVYSPDPSIRPKGAESWLGNSLYFDWCANVTRRSIISAIGGSENLSYPEGRGCENDHSWNHAEDPGWAGRLLWILRKHSSNSGRKDVILPKGRPKPKSRSPTCTLTDTQTKNSGRWSDICVQEKTTVIIPRREEGRLSWR